jgi:hypothetical protein
MTRSMWIAQIFVLIAVTMGLTNRMANFYWGFHYHTAYIMLPGLLLALLFAVPTLVDRWKGR